MIFKDKKGQQTFFELKNELLFLLRSEDTLKEAQAAIWELTLNHYDSNTHFPKNPISKSPDAFLSFVSTLICSCFTHGGNNKRPLDFLYADIKDNPVYLEIKSIRDKRFSHQDNSHPVHQNIFDWRFEKNSSKNFSPTKACYTYDKLHSLSDTELEKWSNFISMLLQKTSEEETRLTNLINPLLEEIEFSDKN